MKLIYKSSRTGDQIIHVPPDRRGIMPWTVEKSRVSGLLRVDLLDSYKQFFGFAQTPFSVSPNPKFFFFSHSHAEALNHLRYGIYEGLGFTLITGEPGTGKTMLSRYFLDKAGDDLRITHFPDPRFSQKELLVAVLEGPGASRSSEEELTHGKLTRRLCDLLLSEQSQSRRVIVVLDEAQGLDFESLEGLRLLSNLETESQKLIQIVLFAQTDLEAKLQEKNLRQFDQRILVRYHLLPLELEEIPPYIQHQLTVAQVDPGVTFTSESVGKIYEISRGLPRMVNAICERAMMSAFAENARTIGLQNVLEGWGSLSGIKILQNQRM